MYGITPNAERSDSRQGEGTRIKVPRLKASIQKTVANRARVEFFARSETRTPSEAVNPQKTNTPATAASAPRGKIAPARTPTAHMIKRAIASRFELQTAPRILARTISRP